MKRVISNVVFELDNICEFNNLRWYLEDKGLCFDYVGEYTIEIYHSFTTKEIEEIFDIIEK